MALGKVQQQIIAKLGEMDRLSSEQQETILATPGDLTGEALDKLLQDEYRISDFQLLVAKARAHGLAPCNVQRFQVGPKTFERIPQDFCLQNLVLPLGQVGEYLLVAFSNPFEVSIATKIHEMTGKKVVRLLGREREIREKFSKSQQVDVQFTDVVEKIGLEFGVTEDIKDEDLASEESGPIIDLANRVIEDAFITGTSDIHIEPWEKDLVIRYRIDGVCQEKLRLPIKVAGALVARLKIMSNLDIAERRLPQDGRIIFKQFTRKSIDIDLRVSTAPLNHGEGIVMRILDKQKSTLPLPMLGFTEANLKIYRDIIRQPYGMVLHCGPTGSGKSMTLYSALNEINSPELVIRTAEDPIEYTLAGINQMQMHRQIGLTFASALRSFLRQDPDVILVGEIRDRETADIAVEAALTGHLLLSTLHTNDAPSAVARLTDMGIEPFMISASLLCICAQRLMRRVCKNCKLPVEPEGREKELIEAAIGWSGQIFKHNPKGCPRCNRSGYKGRVGIHELMGISEELVDGINKKAETSDLKRIAIAHGMKTLHQDSMLKVKEGISTFEEALATAPPDL
jgi:type IV pilus assembly protein PilB